MKTKSKLFATLAMSVAMIGAASFGPSAVVLAQSKDAPKVSRALAKPLKAAQDAMNAKKYDEALARLKEAQAKPEKTPYDEHLINEMLGFVYVRTGKYADAAKALEAGLKSGFLEESEVPTRVKALAQVNYQIKNYDKAIEYGNQAIRSGQGDDDMYTLVAQAYYIKGDYKGAHKFLDNYVNSQIKRRQKPKEQTLQLLMSSCTKMEDSDCTTQALEHLVAYYPKTEYWQNLMYSMFQAKGHTDRTLLHVYRLASEVDVLQRPEDYTEMAQLAIEQGSPGEAQRILEKGFQKNIFPDQRARDRNQRLLDSVKREVANDKATLAQIEKDALESKTGDKDMALGLAYFSYQQYDKAVEAFTRGLAKGGVRNEAEARLMLGIAQLEAGMKEEAIKTFSEVKGDPNFERLANLWSLHARQA